MKTETSKSKISSPPSLAPIRTFRAALRVLEREIGRSLESQTDCCGVTTAQCHTLLELDGAGCVNLKGLAERMELDKSTLSRAVDALVELQLVKRRDDPDNRRQQIICLSADGIEKVANIHRKCDAFYLRLLERIPASRRKSVQDAVGLLGQAMISLRKENAAPENLSENVTTCCGG